MLIIEIPDETFVFLSALPTCVELWEISNPTGGCVAQLSELELELGGSCLSSFGEREELRSSVLRVIENVKRSVAMISGGNQVSWIADAEVGRRIPRLCKCARVDRHSGS